MPREARAEADALAAVKAKNIELERAAEARERELFAMEMQGRAALKLKQLEEERAEAATQAEKKLGQVNREQEEHQAKLRSLIGRTEEGMSGVVDIAAEAFRIQKESNQSFAESFKTAIDAWLSSFAIQEAYKAAAALAEAIGNTVMNQPHAAAKYAEFAQHAALAAAAGGAAAAIPSGGSSASAQPTASAPAGGGGGEGGGTVVINYNAPVAEEELGRHQARHERAAQRRYGRVQR